MIGEFSIAAAVAVVGYDLARDTTWQAAQRPRFLRGAALAGSAAALDTIVDIFVDSVKVGELYNSATGAPTRDHLFPVGANVPSGANIKLIDRDAPGTNPINGILDIEG